MTKANIIPENAYGILDQHKTGSVLDSVAEQVINLGYATLDSGYSAFEIETISDAFKQTRRRYIEKYGEAYLKSINEFYTLRSPLTQGSKAFLNLALNKQLLSLLKKLIPGKFILNQQNGIINPPQENYEQGAWHRDLPYQHFVSSKPLAINALFCLDDFTCENGATWVIPASHKTEVFPSVNYIQRNALQVTAKAGFFLVLDCMLFHSGGYNSTHLKRHAVNHVFTIPYFKQQINIPMNINFKNISKNEKEILGFKFMEPASVNDYLKARESIAIYRY